MADETFERFRRKLADVVTVAINSGKRISGDICAEGDCCPLGCHPHSAMTRPWGWVVAGLWGIGNDDANRFTHGFDGRPCASGPYADLGRLYRARFP